MEIKKELINYKNLERVIVDIEHVFKVHNCDHEEKQLVIKQLNQRLLVQLQKQKTSDLVNGFGGGFVGKLLKRQKDNQDD